MENIFYAQPIGGQTRDDKYIPHPTTAICFKRAAEHFKRVAEHACRNCVTNFIIMDSTLSSTHSIFTCIFTYWDSFAEHACRK